MTLEKKYKIIGFGSPIVDYLAYVSEDFVASLNGDKGGMVLVDNDEQTKLIDSIDGEIAKVPGGSAANTLFALAKLGVNSGFLGQIGGDETGEFYKNCFAELGGDTKGFFTDEDNATGRCLSLVTPDSERTMRTCLGAAATLDANKVTADLFEDITHVHIEGYMAFCEGLFLKVIELAKAANCIISLDLASFEVVNIKRDLLDKVLAESVDIVFSNEDEAAAFCGTENSDEQIVKLSENCEIAVLKLGKDGAMLKKQGEDVVKVGANVVKAVDTTGAGDFWQCGFFYGLLNGFNLEKCGKFGSVMGSEVVQVMGVDLSEKRWNAVDEQFKAIIAE
ncbi:adenosine kinase [Lentisphaerota bacterium WC36G]|nr:adenosine kinase [Lentisphaerae bacterium WC36]